MTDTDLLNTYTEVFVMTDEDDNDVPPHFECSHCPRDVTDEPCPDHAPLTDLPGLRLIDCDAAPRHYTWVHNREDYGVPCPWCLRNDHAKAEAEARRCRHWAWRRTRALRWLAGRAYSLGVISGYTNNLMGDGHDGCLTSFGFNRRPRPYILGVSRGTWRCWLRGRHLRGDDIGILDYCGKCMPWPCCGSERYEHNDGCAEDGTR